MSGGEFIPNGSMWWCIEEEDVTGNGGSVQRAKNRPNLKGRDPINNNQIGRGKNKSHPDALLVTLRFSTDAEARSALQAALGAVSQNATSGLWEAEVQIRVAPTSKANAEKDFPNAWAQARVEW
jgi:hypothetical protein